MIRKIYLLSLLISVLTFFYGCSKSTDTTDNSTATTTSSTALKRYISAIYINQIDTVDSNNKKWDILDDTEPDLVFDFYSANQSSLFRTAIKYNRDQSSFPVVFAPTSSKSWTTGSGLVNVSLSENSSNGDRTMSTWSIINVLKATSSPIKLNLNDQGSNKYQVDVYWADR